jgi:hypothetical protein
MGANQISRRALLTIAAARARYADHATGRNSRPTNERLAADTGYSVRTVQRADTVLRLLGVATEVVRGRQRTRIERLASWRVGDSRPRLGQCVGTTRQPAAQSVGTSAVTPPA